MGVFSILKQMLINNFLCFILFMGRREFDIKILWRKPLFIFENVKNEKRYSKRFGKKGVGFGAVEKDLSLKGLFHRSDSLYLYFLPIFYSVKRNSRKSLQPS